MLGDDGGPTPFGPELRRRRLEADLTLAGLSGLTHYSRSHLSKIENGLKAAGVALARRCDAALGASGELAALVAVNPPAGPKKTGPGAGEIWMMALAPDGRHEFGRLVDGGLLAAGGAALMSWAAPPMPRSASDETSSMESMYSVFAHMRQLGQAMSPSTLVPVLVTLTNAMRVLAQQARPASRGAMLVLASRFAEYTGWMAQEKGDDSAALWWTDQAVDLATIGGDEEMAGYAHVRRALVALYRHDAIATVSLAQQAQRAKCHPRVHGLAAQREAQGHAIAGDYSACRRLLDQARTLMARADDPTGAPPFGTSTVIDPVEISTGWCLHELGRSEEAASILATELARIPLQAERAHARYGARLALALASMREIEQACVVASPILDALPRIDSATIRADLGRLAQTLNRWHSHANVRQIMPKLGFALRTHAAYSG